MSACPAAVRASSPYSSERSQSVGRQSRLKMVVLSLRRERCERRLTTGRLRQARSRGQQERSRCDLSAVEVGRRQLPVRRRRVTVKVNRGTVGRRHLAERRGSHQSIRAHLDQRRSLLVGVQIDADPAEHRGGDGLARRHAAIFGWTRERARPPCGGGAGLVISEVNLRAL